MSRTQATRESIAGARIFAATDALDDYEARF
jgi:hypothetical protein